jgi:hypothetical protein
MVKGKGIGGHTAPNKGEFIIWLTPPSILQFLGRFDLDPCAAPSPRPWPTATQHIELPEDGLSLPWAGRVWLNPPYDETLDKWMERMAAHKSGIALTFARTETTSGRSGYGLMLTASCSLRDGSISGTLMGLGLREMLAGHRS